MRRLLAVVAVALCLAGVIGYQVAASKEPPKQADARVFVPSPAFYLRFSPSFRTSLADVYYLSMVQYYGMHIKTDGRLDSLPAMLALVTELSPRFANAYHFGAFALLDAGFPQEAYDMLERGFKENPKDYRFPANLGFFAYRFGQGEAARRTAAKWYEQAAAIPGSPDYLPRLAAVMHAKGGETEKAVLTWGQVYAEGDKYARQKAVDGLNRVLPSEKQARIKALAPLAETMPREKLDRLVEELFEGYK